MLTATSEGSREQYFQPGTGDQLSQSTARALKKWDEAFLDQPIPVGPALQPAAVLLHIEGTVQRR